MNLVNALTIGTSDVLSPVEPPEREFTQEEIRAFLVARYRQFVDLKNGDRYLIRNTPPGQTDKIALIRDPGQGNQMVSEGQAYWMMLAQLMQIIDPAHTESYQNDYDQLARGMTTMIQLAQDAGSLGQFPAWKIFPRVEGWQNSASDADLDYVTAVLYEADSNPKEREHALTLIRAAKNLFVTKGDRMVMKKSEDQTPQWSDQSIHPDYHDPAACLRIALFLKKHYPKETSEIAFWEQRARDSLEIYRLTIHQLQNIPERITMDGLTVTSLEDGKWGAVRSSDKIGRYLLLLFALDSDSPYRSTLGSDMAFGSEAYKAITQSINTESDPLDAAMPLALAATIGDQKMVRRLLKQIFSQSSDPKADHHYYQNTLVLRALAYAYFYTEIDAAFIP